MAPLPTLAERMKLPVTLTYRTRSITKDRIWFAVLLAACLAQSLWMTTPANAQTDESFALQFHSFVPAKPFKNRQGADSAKPWRNDMFAARRAWRDGDYQTAHDLLNSALKNGNVTAAWYLGHLYRLGRGVQPDPGKAFHLYRKVWLTYNSDRVSDRKFMVAVDALVHVADGYRNGIKSAGIQKNPKRAYNLYMRASGYRHPGADHGLAMIFLKGNGVRKNPKRAIRWLQRAARRGYAPSKTVLGDLFWHGNHVRRDRTQAVMWYILAKNTTRPRDYPNIYNRLDKMLSKVSIQEHQVAQTLAIQWSQRHSQNRAIIPVAD